MKINLQSIWQQLRSALLFLLEVLGFIIIQYLISDLLTSFGTLGQLLGAPEFRGHSYWAAGFSFSVCMLLAVVTYTFVGCLLRRKYGFWTDKFKIHFLIWYIVYILLTTIIFYDSTRAWFWVGYGWYLIDVEIAPLLLLGVIALYTVIQGIIKKLKQKNHDLPVIL